MSFTFPQGWIRSPWNYTNVMVLVASWVYLLFEGYSDKMGLEKDDLMYKYVSMIRVFRVLRPMRTLRLFSGVTLVISTIADDRIMIRNVSGFCPGQPGPVECH